MKKTYKGKERRKFTRFDYTTPLDYKVCKKATISKLLKGYTSNVSQNGLLCNIKQRVKKNDIVWISFDRTTLDVCESLERGSFIYQSGIIGKVVRVKSKPKNSYEVGIQFITRREKNLTNIHPKVYFLKRKKLPAQEQEEEIVLDQQEELDFERRHENEGNNA